MFHIRILAHVVAFASLGFLVAVLLPQIKYDVTLAEFDGAAEYYWVRLYCSIGGAVVGSVVGSAWCLLRDLPNAISKAASPISNAGPATRD